MVQLRSYRMRRLWQSFFVIIGLGLISTACYPSKVPSTPCPNVDCPVTNFPEPVRYEDLWSVSAHSNGKSDAFTNWDEEDPPEIPNACAKCHSRPGYIDYLGIDGTSVGRVDGPAELGTTITCYVCHNEATDDQTSVVFPSGEKIIGLGAEAHCIRCHQGIGSSIAVEDAIAELDLPNDDMPSEELSFINSHAISAATPFGTEVQGAYEYSGSTYVGRFTRGDEFFSCIRCHNQHTLEIKIDTCGDCHTIPETEIRDIRVDTTDYDGDGNNQVGIAYEIDSFHNMLLAAIRVYAEDVIGTPIGFDPHTYPYFFIDSNNNGEIESEEAVFNNRYLHWTPRLFRAAYNYNYVSHDPGTFAHNSDYILQALYDSIADVDGDVSKLVRP